MVSTMQISTIGSHKKEKRRWEKDNLCELWLAGVLSSGIVQSIPDLEKLMKEVLEH